MTNLTESYLFEHYPALFIEGRRWCGFSTGSGWDKILTDLFDAMLKIPDHPHVLQVKEKFGGLRVYVSYHLPEVAELVRQAEILADQTCEECGTTEQVDTEGDGWIKTLCPTCKEKRRVERGG